MEIHQKNSTPNVRPFKVTDQSATYDFLLVIHNNHRPISYRFQDKKRYL